MANRIDRPANRLARGILPKLWESLPTSSRNECEGYSLNHMDGRESGAVDLLARGIPTEYRCYQQGTHKTPQGNAEKLHVR